MAKPSPKDIQLYALIGLIVIAVGVVGKPLLFPDPPPALPSSTASPAPGASPAVAGVVAGLDNAPTPQASPGASSAYILGGRNRFATGGRDPFTPVPDELIAKESVPLKNIPPVPSLPIRSGGIGLKNLQDGLAIRDRNRIIEQELRDIEGAPPPPRPPVVRVLTPPPPPYTVAGVLIGEPGGRDVAILKRDGTEGDKKFVVVGDSLEGGFTVTAIESAGVVVNHPGRPTVTTEIPGSPSIPTGNAGATYRLKQTTIVPASTVTLPIAAANPVVPTTVSRAR